MLIIGYLTVIILVLPRFKIYNIEKLKLNRSQTNDSFFRKIKSFKKQYEERLNILIWEQLTS